MHNASPSFSLAVTNDNQFGSDEATTRSFMTSTLVTAWIVVQRIFSFLLSSFSSGNQAWLNWPSNHLASYKRPGGMRRMAAVDKVMSGTNIAGNNPNRTMPV